MGCRAGAVLLALAVGACNFTSTPTSASDEGVTEMSSQTDCSDNAVARSRCIIEAILEDVGKTYKPTGGGGISMIKQDATNVYTVSISQEERKDLITYTVEVSDGGDVSIVDRATDTVSRGH